MQKKFFLPILFLVIFLFIIYFLLPQWSEVKELNEFIKEKENKIAQRKKEISRFEEISSKLEEYKSSLEKINRAIPQEISMADLTAFFQKESIKNGLILNSFNQTKNPRKKKEEGRLKTAYFDVNLVGKFSAFESFLKSLESSSRMFDLDLINIRRKDESSLAISLIVKVHYFK